VLRLAVVVLLCAALLAGCASKGPAAPVPSLQASATTGVIRVVVVDTSIRPLSNATVTVTHGGAAVQTKATGADGFAGFQGLAPGTYFLEVHKAHFADAQQSVDVVAGVADPPVAKVQLAIPVGGLAFFQEFKLDGFMECAGGGGNWCFIANYYPCLAEQTAGQPCTGNLTNDNSFFTIDKPLTDLQRVPDWLQAELVWESTQAALPYMTIRLDIDCACNTTIDNATTATGTSPVLAVYNPDYMVAWHLGIKDSLALEAFPGSPPEACAVKLPQVSLCSLGIAAEQRITYIVHTFYGYKPPEGWRFTKDGEAPPP
jgi:hypothetical protein